MTFVVDYWVYLAFILGAVAYLALYLVGRWVFESIFGRLR